MRWAGDSHIAERPGTAAGLEGGSRDVAAGVAVEDSLEGEHQGDLRQEQHLHLQLY